MRGNAAMPAHRPPFLAHPLTLMKPAPLLVRLPQNRFMDLLNAHGAHHGDAFRASLGAALESLPEHCVRDVDSYGSVRWVGRWGGKGGERRKVAGAWHPGQHRLVRETHWKKVPVPYINFHRQKLHVTCDGHKVLHGTLHMISLSAWRHQRQPCRPNLQLTGAYRNIMPGNALPPSHGAVLLHSCPGLWAGRCWRCSSSRAMRR